MHGSLHLIMAHEAARVRLTDAREARLAASFRRPFAVIAARVAAAHGVPRALLRVRKLPPWAAAPHPCAAADRSSPGSAGTGAAQRGVGPGSGGGRRRVRDNGVRVAPRQLREVHRPSQ